MRRSYYYVMLVDRTWSVRFEQQVRAEKYVTLIDAIDAARLYARARWETQGQPCGVIIEAADGSKVIDELHGEDSSHTD